MRVGGRVRGRSSRGDAASAGMGLSGRALALSVAAGCMRLRQQGWRRSRPSTDTTTFPTTPTLPPTSFDHVAQGPQPPKTGAWVGAFVKPDDGQPGRPRQRGRRLRDGARAAAGHRARLPRLGRTDPDRLRPEFGQEGRGPAVLVRHRHPGDPAGSVRRRHQAAGRRPQGAGTPRSCSSGAGRWTGRTCRARSGRRRTTSRPGSTSGRSSRREGATNVGWVWCPLATGFTDGRAQKYYPGDDQVDWLCADVYPGTRSRRSRTRRRRS